MCLHPDSRHTTQKQLAVPCFADNKNMGGGGGGVGKLDLIIRPVTNI